MEKEKEEEKEEEKEDEETTTIVPLFFYSKIKINDDCKQWVTSNNKTHINLMATPSGKASLNFKLYTKTRVNSAKV
jgi:hypothetical protein